MAEHPRRTARLASLICFSALLAACGHTDPGARQAGRRGTPATASSSQPGSDSATELAHASSLPDPLGSDDTEDDDSADNGWPALRTVPGGVLTWKVIYKGDGISATREQKEVATLHRQMQGHARMRGNAGLPNKSVAGPLDDAGKEIEACGDDEACKQAAEMRMMNRLRQDRDAMTRGMQKAQLAYQSDTYWYTESCDANAKTDDTAVWTGMTTQGFAKGVATRAGSQAIEECPVAVAEGDTRPWLMADDASKTYDLALPPAQIRVTSTIDGRVEQQPRRVSFPALLIRGAKYDTLDKPLSGHATLHVGSGNGIWSEGWGMPLTEEVSWTFTPDAK